jgi:hypothetical protein
MLMAKLNFDKTKIAGILCQRRVLLWTAFCVVCLFSTTFSIRQQLCWRARMARWENQYLDQRRVQNEIFEPVYESARKSADLLERFTDKPSRNTVERLLNNGKPLVITDSSKSDKSDTDGILSIHEEAVFVDPDSGWKYKLSFRDGYLTWVRCTMPPPPRPAPSPGWFLCDQWRSVVIDYGFLFWACTLILLLICQPLRLVLAELLLAVSITCFLTLLPFLFSDFRTMARSIAYAPLISFGLVMIFASLTALSLAYYNRPQPHKLVCPVCEYNLAGNVSGVCPECGTPVPVDIKRRLKIRIARITGKGLSGELMVI